MINPNGNSAATEMMVAQAQRVLDDNGLTASVRLIGKTNLQAPLLLVSPADMQLAAEDVLALGLQAARALTELEKEGAIIVAAFSDPGLSELRARLSIPVLGIGESVLLEAGTDHRRFGIVTITPDADLLASFSERAEALGIGEQYCGARVTHGDGQGEAQVLLANPELLDKALALAINESITDGAEAIVLGGGPLSAAAERLQPQFKIPLLNPVTAAARAGPTHDRFLSNLYLLSVASRS